MSDKKEKVLPSSSIKMTIENNTYEVKVPTVGQLIDIENMKVSIANYGIDTRKESGAYASLLNEAIASFSVLIPALKKDLTLPSLFSMNLVQSKKIARVYTKEFKPWFDKWIMVINTDDDEDLEEEVSGN